MMSKAAIGNLHVSLWDRCAKQSISILIRGLVSELINRKPVLFLIT